MTELSVRPTTSKEYPRIKCEPSPKVIGTVFSYSSSRDGTDENLLLLLHGLGDTHLPFAKMGHTLNLPQCAILSLRAPEKVPFLYEEAYQWYPSFDQLGELIENPNPSETLDWLLKVLKHLVDDCEWPANRIHLLGFSQGGSVASELALRWWRSQRNDGMKQPIALSSVVSISGPLLSYPTIAQDTRCPSPILFFHWSDDAQVRTSGVGAFSKGYVAVRDIKIAGSGGMPRSRDEWYPIMQFWSEMMGRRELSGAHEIIR